MGATKTHQYSAHEIEIANIADALSHPARIRILNIIQQTDFIRNVDLEKELQLVKSTVHHHLTKLKLAQLIDFEFIANSYRIILVKNLSEVLHEQIDLWVID